MAEVNIYDSIALLEPFVALTTGANVDVTSAPATVGGVTLDPDDSVLLNAQNTASENGGWVFHGVGQPMTRRSDMAVGAVIKSGTVFSVLLGEVRAKTFFTMYATSDGKSDITIGTTAFTLRMANDGKRGYAGYVPAASGAQADATELLSAHNVVLLGGDGYSAKPPLYSAHEEIVVNNLRNFTLLLYPYLGGDLGAGTNIPVTIQPYEIVYLLGIGDIGLGQRWVLFRPVSQTVTPGVKATAPSEDAVFNALALKQDISILGGSATPITLSTTGADEITNSFQIPAGALTVNDFFEIFTLTSATNNANSKTAKIWFNTSNSLVGATQVAVVSITSNAFTLPFSRCFSVESDTTIGAMADGTSSIASKYGNSATIGTNTITVPSISAGFWIIITGSKAVGGDVVIHKYSYVKRY